MKLEAKGISRNYFRNGKGTNWFCAVEPTDLILPEGSLTELVGRSGSGKTTLSNMLAGLLVPTGGTVMLDGEDLYALDDKRRSMLRGRHIGVVPQGQTGLQSLTVMENVLAPSMMYRDTAGKEERARELLGKMGILDLADVYSNELSGGELRRMSIARAMINSPEILIADEPTADLDDAATELVLKLLRAYADGGASVLVVTHEKDARRYADLLLTMEDHKVTASTR